MKLALLQMDVTLGRPEANLAKASSLIEEAVEQKPDVIILPEMWNTGYDLEHLEKTADRDGEPCARAIGRLARKYNVNIVAGSVADITAGNTGSADKTGNTSYIFNRAGEEIARYSKVHLFGLMKEGKYLTRGNVRASFYLDQVCCGTIICYDLRFPELTRALALDGIRILFVPAQWPNPRMYPWRALLVARAIENQMFVVGVNRVGREDKTEFFGHSMVVGPQGEVLAEGSEREEIIYAEIDPHETDKIRRYMTCYKDRAPQVYQ